MNIVKNLISYGIFALVWAKCTPKAVPEMQSDMADNKLDERYHISVNVCPHPMSNIPVRLHRKKLRDAIPQFLILLKKQLPTTIEEEIQYLKKANIFVNARKYGKCCLKELNPKASKKHNMKLGIPRNKQARHLFETAWWLTSMLTTAHELKGMLMLSSTSRLIPRLEQIATYALNTVREMNVKIPERSSVCTRNTTIQFPLHENISYSDKVDYTAVALLDMRHALNQIITKLEPCKIVVKKSKSRKSKTNRKSRKNRKSEKGKSKKRSKIAKIRCKNVKSVFYKKNEGRSRRHCSTQ